MTSEPLSDQANLDWEERRSAAVRRLRGVALQAVARGRFREALAACWRLEHLEPFEPAWPRRTAYCLGRLRRHAEEAAALKRAARGYERNGFLLKADAMYRLALAITPNDEDLLQRAAELRAGRNIGLEARQAPPALRYLTPSELPPPMESRLVDDYHVVEFIDTEVCTSQTA
jgi:hypothetical protein